MALQKELAWNDSTVILIYKPLRAICSVFSDCYFCCLYSTFCRGAPQSHLSILLGDPARNEGTQRTGSTTWVFCFSSPCKTFSLVPQMPMSPSTSTTEDFESRAAVILRGYNFRQSALSLRTDVTASITDATSRPQLGPVLQLMKVICLNILDHKLVQLKTGTYSCLQTLL